MREVQRSFTEEFERVLVETDTSIRRLARLSGIPRRTLENWLYGHTRRPRHVEQILQVAHALHLPANDADRLLASAGHPSLAELKKQKNPPAAELLLDWQLAPDTLIGQKSAALPAQHNLPAATTPFLGRSETLEDLAILLRRPDLRLVTVIGLGGAGKTRLSLETARSLVDWFDHGVYFVPLDNVNDAQGFWEAILDGLDIPYDGLNSAQQLVENYLQNKQILLVLDNFEHLLPLTAELSNLLAKSERLNLLVTSRQALDLQAEQVCTIGGLSCEEGQESAAFQLYLETARRRSPGYQPPAREADDVIALCSQVDGLPLAIELAASWSDVLTPAQILAQLRSDLQEVWHDAADRPDRQKSLWDLFNYSWQMLSQEEQEAAMRLSVLRGTFTPPAALAVAACQPAVLKRLIQASFIMRTSGSRLMIHRLVRQFLSQQAVRAGYAVEDLESRFMELTLAWAAAQSSQLRQTFEASYFQSLHAEWQHFERAWWLAVKNQCYDLLDSCWDILMYFETHGNWGQANSFFEATRQQLPNTNRRMQARLDEAQAYTAYRLLEISQAKKLARRSLETLNELGIDSHEDAAGAYARVVLTSIEFIFSQTAFTDENKQALKEAAYGHHSKYAEVAFAMSDGVNRFAQGDFPGASSAFEDALDVCGPDAYTVPIMRCFLGISMREQDQEIAAREQFTLALNRALDLDIYPAVVGATYELRLLQRDNPSYQDCLDALTAQALEMGSRSTVGRLAVNSAIQYMNLGLFKRARRLARAGVALIWDEVDTAERARLLSTIAQAYIAFGMIKHAPQVLSLIAPNRSASAS